MTAGRRLRLPHPTHFERRAAGESTSRCHRRIECCRIGCELLGCYTISRHCDTADLRPTDIDPDTAYTEAEYSAAADGPGGAPTRRRYHPISCSAPISHSAMGRPRPGARSSCSASRHVPPGDGDRCDRLDCSHRRREAITSTERAYQIRNEHLSVRALGGYRHRAILTARRATCCGDITLIDPGRQDWSTS